MAVTVDRFKLEYREFRGVSADLCRRKLMHAERVTNKDMFGDQTDHAVMLKTAHLLATSPAGEAARLELEDTTLYERELEKLARAAAIAYMRVS